MSDQSPDPSKGAFELICPNCGKGITCLPSDVGHKKQHLECGQWIEVEENFDAGEVEPASPPEKGAEMRKSRRELPTERNPEIIRRHRREHPATAEDPEHSTSSEDAEEFQFPDLSDGFELGPPARARLEAEARAKIQRQPDSTDGRGLARKSDHKALKKSFRSRLWSSSVKGADVDQGVDVRAELSAATRAKEKRTIEGQWDHAETGHAEDTPAGNSPAGSDASSSSPYVDPRRARIYRLLWTIPAVTLVIACIGYFLKVSLPRTQNESAGGNRAAELLEPRFNVVPEVRMKGDLPLSPQQLAEAFLTAQSAREKAQFVRAPQLMLPIIDAFLSSPAGLASLSEKELQPFRIVRAKQLHYDSFVAGSGAQRRLVCVVNTPEGWLVDWEAYARINSHSFEALLAGELAENGGIYRVLIRSSTYFNYGFSENEWASFEILSPDLGQALTGYAPVRSPLQTALSALTKRKPSGKAPRPQMRCVLRLQASAEQGSRHQVEIVQLLQMGWVTEKPGSHLPEPQVTDQQ